MSVLCLYPLVTTVSRVKTLNLPHGTKTKKVGKKEKLKSKKESSGVDYQKTVQGIHGVTPGEEKEGYGGKDLQKTRV